MIDVKHIKMLNRLRKGECPRCSIADFDKLRAILPGQLQLESAHGARGGMSLTYLHNPESTNAAIDKLLASLN